MLLTDCVDSVVPATSALAEPMRLATTSAKARGAKANFIMWVCVYMYMCYFDFVVDVNGKKKI